MRCIGQTLCKNIFGNRVSRAIKKLSTIKSIRIVEKSLALLAELFIYLGGSLAGRGSIGIKGEKDILTEPLWKEDLPLCVVLIDDRVSSLLSSIKWTFGMLEETFSLSLVIRYSLSIDFLDRSNEVSNLSPSNLEIVFYPYIDFYISIILACSINS